MLRPFFTYYGGKFRVAPRYPAPLFDTVIEPFAGAAGYALRYPQKRVLLIDLDPTIAETWSYLIGASSADIEALPLLAGDQTVDDLQVPAGARHLIGFWLNKGCNGPRKSPSAWMRSGLYEGQFWGHTIRARIASQVPAIKHWRIMAGDYRTAPDIEATWFIDAPYQVAGRHYRHGSTAIDFHELGEWCRSRRGQAVVCENVSANWLPFRHFLDAKSMENSRGKSTSAESIWVGGAA